MDAEHVDVLVVGAGLSGIGAAFRIQTRTKAQTYAVLEAREAIGGTWDLFRYPGIRSDTDMYTFGYPFRPWTRPESIASGEAILQYIADTAATTGVDRHIRFRHRVVRAAWSSAEVRWTVDVEVGAERNPARWTCRFLYLCTGYYSYAGGNDIELAGRDEFGGLVVHPQQWPADLDYAGKRIVVIGSGATAATLVPALAERAAHVTMVQRSPSHVLSRPTRDRFTTVAQRLLPARMAYRMVRARNVALSVLMYEFVRNQPERAAAVILRRTARELGGVQPVDPHFSPAYPPWDQRPCLVADGDFFKALRSGKAEVVTDLIETLTPGGLRLAGGAHLDADIVVTATGLRMIAFGGVSLSVDGEPVDVGRSVVYQGMMLGGVPNLTWCVGYPNNAWTLRADLTAVYVCRLLNHMSRNDWAYCVPEPSPEMAGAAERPLLDLKSGYIRRAAAGLPKQGARQPWRLRTNYLADLAALRLRRIDDGVIRLGRGLGPGLLAPPPIPAGTAPRPAVAS